MNEPREMNESRKMNETQEITILGTDRLRDRTYRIRYEEDGVERIIDLEFEGRPDTEGWAILGTQSVLELADRKPSVSRDFFRMCVRICRGEIAPPVTVSAQIC